jgi:erythronate-4-phosphate dehydrogenase
MLKILADENIALVREAFGPHGELRTIPGRQITAASLEDVDVLLVRSVTRVNAALLANAHCSFVGTATSGLDHVDLEMLKQRGIAFAAAQGSNADSVVDYVFSALAALSEAREFDWCNSSFGIIGCGAIGSRLVQRLEHLGVHPLISDPLLQSTHSLASNFAPLEAVLKQDVVCVHAALTSSGNWPTRHLLNKQKLSLLQPGAVVINAARGEIVDGAALLARKQLYPDTRLVLDAWEHEPDIDQQLLQEVELGTPHVAGYSVAGKIRGTAMVYEAFCRHFGLQPQERLFALQKSSPTLHPRKGGSRIQALNRCILAAYDIRKDHARMQQLAGIDAARGFDALRKNYPLRLEFAQLELPAVEVKALSQELADDLKALGFVLHQ